MMSFRMVRSEVSDSWHAVRRRGSSGLRMSFGHGYRRSNDTLGLFTLRPLDVVSTDQSGWGVVRARAFVGTGVETGVWYPPPAKAVQWTVTSGGGTVVVENDPTDGNGAVSALWTLGSAAGPQTLTATLLTPNGQPSNIRGTSVTSSSRRSRTAWTA